MLSNRYETATLYWACQMLGLIFTPFNWRANDEEVSYVLDNAEAVGVVFEERSRPAVGGAIGRTVGRMITFDIDDGHFDDLRDSEPVDGPSETDDTEICLMLYTSGTTGRPKGVPRSHEAERLAASHCVAQLYYLSLIHISEPTRPY